MSGGFGSDINRCVTYDNASDLIIVILPGRVSFRFDHVLIRFSIFARVSCELKSHILETSGGNVTPKILIGLCSQSKLCSLHNVSVEFILDPIHNALVFFLY